MRSAMAGGSSWLVALLLALAAFGAGSAEAQRLRRDSVVLEGYVGEAPAGVATEARLVLRAGAKDVAFAVTRTAVTTGSRPRRQILHDARPHQNTLVLRGADTILSTLTSTAAGTQLRISGEHRMGTNTLHVSGIEPMTASPTPAAATP